MDPQTWAAAVAAEAAALLDAVALYGADGIEAYRYAATRAMVPKVVIDRTVEALGADLLAADDLAQMLGVLPTGDPLDADDD